MCWRYSQGVGLCWTILVYLASLDEASRMRVRREQDGRIPA